MSKRILAANDILQYGDGEDDETTLLRLLYSDYVNDIAFIISINGDKGLPVFRRLSLLTEDISLGIAKVMSDDPWARIITENELAEKEKETRDKAWKFIEDLIKTESELAIYDWKTRGQLVQEAARKHDTTPRTMYKYLRRYWQRGKTKNALLPDYQNSGGRGKERKLTGKKLGRKRKFAHVAEIGEGVNVDEKIKKVFRAAISQFYYKPSETSLQTAFDLMISKYFVEDYINEGGVKKPILIPQDQKPTYAQFYYFYNKEKNIKKAVTSRKGKSAYALGYRPILGSATHEVFAPGSRYEIDATVADVYLVSSYNSSWIIGRPVVYVVIDVFSRMIAGVYIGIEGPSWIGAMMALANTVANKKDFCAEYDIAIDDEDWECDRLPETILADGGEISGKAVEALATNLNIRIETASPYRGDLKGIVERFFNTIKEKVKPFLPGQIITDAYKRRGYDYRLDAKLNIHQFTHIILTGILQHNRSYLGYYERDAEMIADNVQPTPLNLWRWGIRNRSGRLHWFPEDIVKLNLLPSDSGRITRGGILFKDMEYSCERAIKEGWFEKGSHWSGEKVQIVYDMRMLNYVYLRADDGRSFDKCYLLPTEEKYMNRDFYDIEHLQNYEQLKQQLSLPEKQQEFADLAATTMAVVKEAAKIAARDQDPTASKASRVANINEKRELERDARRENEAFELGRKDRRSKPAVVVPIRPGIRKAKEIEDELSYPEELELLAQIREQKKEEQKDGREE